MLSAGCAQFEGLFGDQDDEADAEEIAQEGIEEGPTIPYQVNVEGALPDELRSLLEQVSDAARRVDRPPSSLAVLNRRAENDVPRLDQALRSEGYYANTVDVRTDPTAEPVEVTFEVTPGPRYTFSKIAIEAVPPTEPFEIPSARRLGLRTGAPARAQTVLDAESKLLTAARNQGFALAVPGTRRAVVDHDHQVMDVTLVVDLGPLTRFGKTTISGLTTVEEPFVRRRLRWQRGELITPKRLEDTREELIQSGLFSGIRINLAESADPDGEVPVTIQLEQRAPRSIGFGARYRTDEGFGGNISWEHRNLFGQGERVKVAADASEINLDLSVEFRKPDVLRTDQAFVVEGGIANETPEAYDSKSVGVSAGFERRLGERKEVGISLAYRFADIEQFGERERFGLLSLPAYLLWDESNDLLNPSKGWRAQAYNTPFIDTLNTDLTFNRTRVDYAHYFLTLRDPTIILAGRVALGTIFGAELLEIPADERFYAGGGGSVRGWGFQRAGQLDDEGNPIGGRSLFESSAEIRTQVTETLGGVVFVDAGAAYPQIFPSFDDIFIGTGFGLRYFSPVGPLRADIGFPIDPRPSDDLFQIYISLGQAF